MRRDRDNRKAAGCFLRALLGLALFLLVILGIAGRAGDWAGEGLAVAGGVAGVAGAGIAGPGIKGASTGAERSTSLVSLIRDPARSSSARSSESRCTRVARDFCRPSRSFSAPAAPRMAAATPLPVEPSP